MDAFLRGNKRLILTAPYMDTQSYEIVFMSLLRLGGLSRIRFSVSSIRPPYEGNLNILCRILGERLIYTSVLPIKSFPKACRRTVMTTQIRRFRRTPSSEEV